MEVLYHIQTLMETTPSDLLPCHCHLLDIFFYNLGNVETIQHQLRLLLWNQHSAPPPRFPPPDTLHQAACQFSIHGSPVCTHKDLSIITYKPLLGPGPILHAVPISRLSRRHFGSLLDHNQLVCHLRTLTTPTSQAHTIASIRKENGLLFLIQVWSDLFASCCDKNGLLGHYIAPVQLLCLHDRKERQKLVCPYTRYYK
jgi:hypothetical protein